MSKAPFKILGIGSGRVMGSAEIMLRECLMECERLGNVETRIVRLRTLRINTCDGCLSCMQDAANGGEGLCPKQDDFQWLQEQILWADAIVFSAPSFLYIPTSEVITMMNRALGCGKDYVNQCRSKPKLVSLICVGGSDTVDFNLPMQFYALERMCKGCELVDQFYANWVRGKGFIVKQPHHLARARLQAKRLMNRLNGYSVPEIHTTITKLNPMEHADDQYVELEGCPVCHSAVVHMDNEVFKLGKFTCSICGATGHVEHHANTLKYVWDDDTVAHNRLHADFDQQYLDAYAKAHTPAPITEAVPAEFPELTPGSDPAEAKPRILALVAGPKGGTSELLARRALESATADGHFEGAIIRLTDLNLHFCTGCLLCKVNARYRGGIDECVLKDDDLWVVDKILDARAILFSFDGVNGFTYGNVISLVQRFGYRSRTAGRPNNHQRAYASLVSAFDDQVRNVTFPISQIWRQLCNFGPGVAQEFFPNVPLTGDGILANKSALDRAAQAGSALAFAAGKLLADPNYAPLLKRFNGMCPSCGLSMIELHRDMSVSCAMCDAHGQFQHRFGEENIVWDAYDVLHSRATAFGATLHFKHINFSQSDDNNALLNPKLLATELAPYVEYGKLAHPKPPAKTN